MSFSLFRNGQKPAFLCSPDDDSFFQELQKLNKPYLSVTIFTNEMVLFFGNDAIKQAFIRRSNQIETDSPSYHQLIGEVLGYPPAAATFFASCMHNQDLKKRKAGYSYAGMRFVGDIQDLIVIANWCWEKVPVSPEPLEVSYQGEVSYISPATIPR